MEEAEIGPKAQHALRQYVREEGGVRRTLADIGTDPQLRKIGGKPISDVRVAQVANQALDKLAKYYSGRSEFGRSIGDWIKSIREGLVTQAGEESAGAGLHKDSGIPNDMGDKVNRIMVSLLQAHQDHPVFQEGIDSLSKIGEDTSPRAFRKTLKEVLDAARAYAESIEARGGDSASVRHVEQQILQIARSLGRNPPATAATAGNGTGRSAPAAGEAPAAGRELNAFEQLDVHERAAARGMAQERYEDDLAGWERQDALRYRVAKELRDHIEKREAVLRPSRMVLESWIRRFQKKYEGQDPATVPSMDQLAHSFVLNEPGTFGHELDEPDTAQRIYDLLMSERAPRPNENVKDHHLQKIAEEMLQDREDRAQGTAQEPEGATAGQATEVEPGIRFYSGAAYGRGRALPQMPTTPGGQPGYQGETPRQADIARTIDREFDLTSKRGRTGAEQAYYDVRQELMRARTGNLGVKAHELGHHLDSTTDVLKNATLNGTMDLMDLHRDMIAEMLRNPNLTPRQQQVLLNALQSLDPAEGFAEFVRHYLTTGRAKAEAPNFAKDFDAWLDRNPDVRARLAKVQALTGLRNQAPAEQRLDLSGAGQQPRALRRGLLGTLDDAKDWVVRAANRFYTQLFYRHNPIRQMEKEASGAVSPTGPYAYVRALADASPAWFERAFTQNFFDPVTNQDVAGVGRPADVYKDAGLTSPSDVTAFEKYIISRHALSEMDHPATPNDPLNGLLSRADHEAIVQKYDSPRFQAGFERYKGLYDAMLEARVGRTITPEEAQAMRDAHPDFVRLMREVEAPKIGSAAYRGGLLDVAKGVKARKGSDLPIKRPLTQLQTDLQDFYAQMARWMQSKRIVDYTKTQGGMGSWIEHLDPQKLPTSLSFQEISGQLAKLGIDPAELKKVAPDAQLALWRGDLSSDPSQLIVRMIEDGRPELYQLDKTIHDWSRLVSDPLLGGYLDTVGSYATRAVKAGAIGMNVAFAPAKLAYDVWNNLMRRQFGSLFAPYLKGLPAALVARLPERAQSLLRRIGVDYPAYQMMLESGVRHAEFGGRWGEPGAEQLARQAQLIGAAQPTLAEKAKAAAAAPFRVPQGITRTVDEAHRYAEFAGRLYSIKDVAGNAKYTPDILRQMLARGERPDMADIVQATNAARDVYHDFSRQGQFGQKVNKMVPFFSTMLALGEMPVRDVMNRPAQTVARLAAVTAGIVAYTLIRRQDDDYKEQADWTRDTHLTIPGPNGTTAARIPLGHGGYGAIFSMIQAMTNAVADQDPRFLGSWVKDQGEHVLLPPVSPAMVHPLLDIQANRDYFGHPIVNPDLMSGRSAVLPEDRYDPRKTSAPAIWLGKMTGTSPAQWEYALNGYSGNLYGHVQRSIRGEEIPGLSRFQTSGLPAQSVQDVYQRANDLTQRINSARNRGGRDEEAEKESKRLEAYKTLMSSLGNIQREGAQVQKLGGRAKVVQTVPLMQQDHYISDEKIARMRVGLAREALGKPPLPSYPSPLDIDGLPPSLQAIVNNFKGAVNRKAQPRRQHWSTIRD
jgi:hypothetical protein